MSTYYDPAVVQEQGARFSAPFKQYPESIPTGFRLIAVADNCFLRLAADVTKKSEFDAFIQTVGERGKVNDDVTLNNGKWLGYSLYIASDQVASAIPNANFQPSQLLNQFGAGRRTGVAISNELLVTEINCQGHDGWWAADGSADPSKYRHPSNHAREGQILIATYQHFGGRVIEDVTDPARFRDFCGRYENQFLEGAQIFAVHPSSLRPANSEREVNPGRAKQLSMQP